MPVRFVIEPDLDLWYVVGSGVVTGTEYLACLAAAAEEPGFHADIDLLLDLQPVAELDVSLGDIKAIYRMDQSLAGGTRPPTYRAAILARNFTDRSLASLYGALARTTGAQIRTFYRLGEALHWLGHDAAEDRLKARRQQLVAS